MQKPYKLSFIGLGNISNAILSGLLESKAIMPQNIVCNDISEQKLIDFSSCFKINTTPSKQEAIKNADIILLAVKPNDIKAVLEEIKPYIEAKSIIVSIAAGINIKTIENILGGNNAVIRIMPNICSLVREGATAICGGSFAKDEDLKAILELFSCIGAVEIIEEKFFDIITAFSGSGPAYIFYFCHLMIEAGKKFGIKESIAANFAIQSVYGAGKMLAKSGIDAQTLRKNVTSAKGTTQAAIEYFENNALNDIVFGAIEKATERSIAISKSL
jgi:pyrroline-5-carboxylate reductase